MRVVSRKCEVSRGGKSSGSSLPPVGLGCDSRRNFRAASSIIRRLVDTTKGNREQGTGNREQGTGNGERGTGNGELDTRDDPAALTVATPSQLLNSLPVPCSLFPVPLSESFLPRQQDNRPIVLGVRLELSENFGFRLSLGAHQRGGRPKAFARRAGPPIDLEHGRDRNGAVGAGPANAHGGAMRQNTL